MALEANNTQAFVSGELVTADKLNATESDLYLWLFGAAAESAGAKLGSRWSATIRGTCQRHQETRGHAAGSWPSRGDRWARRGGRILSTALAALTIQQTR